MAKSKIMSYLLWLIGGLFGLHHFYLGRDRQAFLWWCTFGFFTIGWLRDIYRIPSYVNSANEEKDFMEWLSELMRKREKPPFSVARFGGQLSMGTFFGYLCFASISEELVNKYAFIPFLIVPLAIAIGIYTVGNAGREEGPLKSTVITAYVTYVILCTQPNSIALSTLISTIMFQRKRKFQRTPGSSRRRTVCSRLLILGLAGCVVTGAWTCAIYFNGSVTTAEGETIKIRDAVDHFFESPFWREFKETIWALYEAGKANGWKQLWMDLMEALDPQGEKNALQVLGLEEGASQDEINKRYRKLAREWHPDRHRGEAKKAEAHEKFMEIAKAHETLSEIKAKRSARNSEQYHV